MNSIRYLLISSCLLAGLLLMIGRAQEPAEPGQPQQPQYKKIFLPKNPVAASYMLRRIPNEELILVERSEPVYEALLQRPGIAPVYKEEALQGLADLHKSTPAVELAKTMERVDQGREEDLPVLSELAPLLAAMPANVLQPVRRQLVDLATDPKHRLTRQIALVGLVAADDGAEQAWQLAQQSPEMLVDFLTAVPLVRDARHRARLAPQIETLVQQHTDTEVRTAAILALPSISGDANHFRMLAGLVQDPAYRAAAIRALQRMPRSRWPREDVPTLAQQIVDYAVSVPAAGRTEDDFLNAIQLGNDLATLLPADESKKVRDALSALGVQVIFLRAVPHQMLYDKKDIYVEAGKPAQIVLENTDIMPHNLVIAAPGQLEPVGVAAERMQTEPDALARSFIPTMPEVLFSVRLLQSSEKDKLNFVAPNEPGEYPYLCTYPGHWRRMFGTMHVVADLSEVPADQLEPDTPAIPTRPIVQAWTVADLQTDIENLQAGQPQARGKQLFKEAACLSCHKVRGEGGVIGPDLTEVMRTKKYTAVDLLREVIEPSHKIDDKYRPQIIQTVEGQVVTGIIVKEDDQSVYIVSNPLVQCEPTIVAKEDIEEQYQAQVSIMPTGLLNTFTREEVLELLAYVRAAGQ